MTERSLAGKAFDIARYAPIAIVLDGPSLLPQLAEQGKVHVKNARFLGRMALRQVASTAVPQAFDFLRMMGLLPDEQQAEPLPTPRSRPEPGALLREQEPKQELAIPDYDSLSASQVVNRLPSLSAEELEAVRAYEAGHRSRKTILNKVAQLQT